MPAGRETTVLPVATIIIDFSLKTGFLFCSHDPVKVYINGSGIQDYILYIYSFWKKCKIEVPLSLQPTVGRSCIAQQLYYVLYYFKSIFLKGLQLI